MSRNRRHTRTVLLAAMAWLSGSIELGHAQGARQTLREAKAIACEFRVAVSGTWDKEGAATSQTKSVSLSVAFSAIDTQEGSAEVASTTGAPPVVVQLSGGYLHVIQVASTGALYTTTVFDKAGRAGRLKAVHTRHEYTEVSLPGYTSRPEQYYGDCEVRH